MIEELYVKELLRIQGRHLYHREGQELEFKEQFNFAGLAEYFRDFAAFANNRGGYLIFGVKDSPRTPTGLSKVSAEQFDKVDPEKITGFLLDIFSADIVWEPALLNLKEKVFGVIRVHEAITKPIIAKKDEGRDQTIKNGEIYYRYGGRTQKIQYAELESIISKRVEKNNKNWLDLMSKIAHAGPQNAAILDTERSLIEKDDTKILVLDENLANKLKYVKEGQFVTKDGAPTLKLVGDVLPVRKVEIVKRVKETLIREYPLSARELADAVREKLPGVKQNDVWQAIFENGMKNNPDYSAYNFRNKRQDDEYQKTGAVPSGTPSIYNHKSVEFLVKVFGTG
jgi:hypothetical protein